MLLVKNINSNQHSLKGSGRKARHISSEEHVNNVWTEARKAFGNAMVASNTYLVIRNLITGHEEERPTPNSRLHDVIHALVKMNKRQKICNTQQQVWS